MGMSKWKEETSQETTAVAQTKYDDDRIKMVVAEMEQS